MSKWKNFKLEQADVTKLVSRLRFGIKPKARKISNPDGSEGRLMIFRKTCTALIKHERIELNYQRADETRGYIERLISDAIRYGDCHKQTMEMADYYILEKQYIHKLFKVLVPRFENMPVSYTRMYKAPLNYPCHGRPMAVLELRGNPFPPLIPNQQQNRNLIHNILMDAAKLEFREAKYAKIAASLAPQEKTTTAETVINKKEVNEKLAQEENNVITETVPNSKANDTNAATRDAKKKE